MTRAITATRPTRCSARAPPSLTHAYTSGLAMVISATWVVHTPMVGGYGAIEAYLPRQTIAIAAAVTYPAEAFDVQGNYSDAADRLFRQSAAEPAPADAPPMPP